jgi:hypothetical protein
MKSIPTKKNVYVVQVYVNKRYINVKETTDLSVAFDKFGAFNRTGDLMSVSAGRSVIDGFADRATRLVRVPFAGKPVTLRKGRTAVEKIAA